jgi:hypothetical protein
MAAAAAALSAEYSGLKCRERKKLDRFMLCFFFVRNEREKFGQAVNIERFFSILSGAAATECRRRRWDEEKF